jgi:hypothetical protein
VALLNGGTSRSSVVAAFLGSSEGAKREVDGLYGIIFDTLPDVDGESYWVSVLGQGYSLAAIVPNFFNTSVYVALANATVG